MAFHYVGGDRDQLFLLATSMRDWLDEGHLAWFVIDVVEKVDTSLFHVLHPNNGPGRPAYDPDMMLALMFYAYGTGVRSSRRIESACRTDAAYRVICGNVFPDHATIARFLVNHERAIESVFVDVLRLCAAAGLVSVGVIALDGTKMGTDAALDATRTGPWIRAEVARILTEAKATDTVENEQESGLFGLDVLPPAIGTRAGRLARLDEALQVIAVEEQAADAADRADTERAIVAAGTGRLLRGRKPRGRTAAMARVEIEEKVKRERAERKAAVRAEREAAAAALGRKVRGRRLKPKSDSATEHEVGGAEAKSVRVAQAKKDRDPARANITDPQSRIMKTQKGWVQGYNAQATVNEHQIVTGHDISQDPNDVGQYKPMIDLTRALLDRAGVTARIGLVVADAGYWSEANATSKGPRRLIATLKDYKQRQLARELGTTRGQPPKGSSTVDAMEHRLRTVTGTKQYAKRSHTVEPVFGDIKENRGFTRFRRRGLNAAKSEWALMTLSHNLTKLFNHQTPATQHQ
jgi:transposase